MDPNAALAKARAALKTLREAQCSYDDAIEELADAFEALDGWLSAGGFVPQDWSKRP